MTDIVIDVVGKGQFTATTCWFASYRMLYSWKHADEKTIPNKITGAGLDFKAMTVRGIFPEELVKAGTALGMAGRAASAVRDYDLDTWSARLTAFGPHWVATQKVGIGHAIVVYGVDKEMKQLHVYDPYNRFQPGTVEKTYWTLQGMQDKLAIYPFAVQVWAG